MALVRETPKQQLRGSGRGRLQLRAGVSAESIGGTHHIPLMNLLPWLRLEGVLDV
jgi:hypothetical protein